MASSLSTVDLGWHWKAEVRTLPPTERIPIEVSRVRTCLIAPKQGIKLTFANKTSSNKG